MKVEAKTEATASFLSISAPGCFFLSLIFYFWGWGRGTAYDLESEFKETHTYAPWERKEYAFHDPFPDQLLQDTPTCPSHSRFCLFFSDELISSSKTNLHNGQEILLTFPAVLVRQGSMSRINVPMFYPSIFFLAGKIEMLPFGINSFTQHSHCGGCNFVVISAWGGSLPVD